MNNFDFQITTNIHFGKRAIESLKDEVLQYGNKVFFIYDEIPVKACGLYQEITEILQSADISCLEFTGAEPNPRNTTVNRGIQELKKYGADCIIAAGGGSTLDCGKAISFGIYHDGDVWDFYSGKTAIEKVMPVIAIPTLAAAGAEISHSAVISNMELHKKMGLRNPKIRPACAILDPTYTFSVPKFHTACGVVDIMSHAYEGYFGPYDETLQDGISEAIQRTCVENGPKVLAEPDNYTARANLMWAADLSISNIGSLGRHYLNGPMHILEHILSAYFDIAHGAGIAIISLAWFKYCMTDQNLPKFAKWGLNVWGIPSSGNVQEDAQSAINAFESFCKGLNLPTHLNDVGITRNLIEKIAETEFDGLKGADTWFRPVTSPEELLKIFTLAL